MPSAPANSVASTGAQRILAAAEQLFSDRGYDSVSVHTIAAAAGVSKANVFHHYRSKRELYLATLRAACEQVIDLLEGREHASATVSERLQRFLSGHLEHVHERGGLTRLVLRELLDRDLDGSRELADQALGHGFNRLVSLVREGQENGELRAGIDPAAAALIMVGANVFYFQAGPLLHHLPGVGFADDRAGFSEAVAEILFRGLVAAPRTLEAERAARSDGKDGVS